MDQKKGGGDKNKRKKKKESKRLKKYNSKRKEFCTLDHTTRAWSMILFVFVHVQLFPFNTIFQYLFPRFRLAFSLTLYKSIVRTFWAWVHSYFGFKSKPVLTIDIMVNYIRLAWQLACILRTNRTCNSMVGFSKYEFNNKLLDDVTFFIVSTCVTWTQLYIS